MTSGVKIDGIDQVLWGVDGNRVGQWLEQVGIIVSHVQSSAASLSNWALAY